MISYNNSETGCTELLQTVVHLTSHYRHWVGVDQYLRIKMFTFDREKWDLLFLIYSKCVQTNEICKPKHVIMNAALNRLDTFKTCNNRKAALSCIVNVVMFCAISASWISPIGQPLIVNPYHVIVRLISSWMQVGYVRYGESDDVLDVRSPPTLTHTHAHIPSSSREQLVIPNTTENTKCIPFTGDFSGIESGRKYVN